MADASGIEDQVAAAQAAVDIDRVVDVCRLLVDVASPTGDEAPLAALIADVLTAAGARGVLQAIDDRQANAWGRLARTGVGGHVGPTVMLYAPIDTLTTGDPAEDLPWAGDEMADHLRPRAVVADGSITGLGAMNPKGHAACILAAVEALHASGVALDGDLVAAFGAGGMPTDSRPGSEGRRHTGQGVGCSFLLEQGVWADAAVIAKSGWAVSHEEVGVAWCDVTVRGTHTYVGSRHLLAYRNPIDDAAAVVAHLERRFAERGVSTRGDGLAPQAVVGAIEGGWWRMPAFVPARARLRVDLRTGPEQSPLDARRELDRMLDELRAERPGLDVEAELTLAIPGSRTDRDHWITRTAVTAWEREAGRPHPPPGAASGATDANILRNRGIPTVRVGLPKATAPDGGPLDFGAGMNTVSVDALGALTRYLVRLAIEATASQHARTHR